ncbi:MAG: diguanylate cyclase domain-containing protein, partial [Hominimerdicola sp.]
NMLKEIPVDILKIDMRFFSDTDDSNRGQNIVASVIRLSKWLNIPAIAEGVETAEQVRFLREIGCEYVQGYYYAKPMTVENYSAYVSSNTVFHGKSEVNSEHTEMLLINSDMEIVFSNMFQPMAFFEYKNRNLEIIRVNDAYYDLFHGESSLGFSISKTKDLIFDGHYENILDAFDKAVADHTAVDCEFGICAAGKGSEPKWLSLKIKYLDTIAGKHVLMGSFTDITAQKQMDVELQKYRTAINSETKMSTKMLIVDDSAVNREYLKLMFNNKFITYEAVNGKEALEFLEKIDNNVDVIMLDINMPVMDGYEFLKHRNANKQLSHIPVIIISADDTPQQQSSVLAMGANDYIVKPFVEEVVIRRVNNVIESDNRFKDILKRYNMPVRNSKTDQLTGICNSGTAEKLIDNIMAINDNLHCLIILDIDDLAALNDEFGREAGDNVLIKLADSMKKYFRASDIIARIGDDEICIFMNSISSAVSIDEKCRQIQENIATMKYDGVTKEVTCCIGASLSEPGDNFKQIYFRAKQALIHAQNTGRGISIVADTGETE